MDPISQPARWPASADTYWLTRFVLLRWMGFVYLVAFYVAARQLVPLVGADGLTPAPLFFHRSDRLGAAIRSVDFSTLPSLFWFNCSDTMLRVVPWIGVVLSCVVLAGYANAIDDDRALDFLPVHRPRRAGLVRLRVGNPDVARPAFSASSFARCSMRGLFRCARRRCRSSFFFAG